MFKINFNLYKTLAMLACFSLMLNSYLLSIDTEDNESIIAQSNPDEDIREAREALDDATPPLTADEIDRIANADFYKQKDIHDFLNKVIVEIPIEIPSSIITDLFTNKISQKATDENPIRINLRLCNGDLVRIPLQVMDLYADYLLKNALKEFYIESTFKKIINNTENFIEVLKSLDPFIGENKDSEEKEENNLIVKDEKYYKQKEKDVFNYINKTQSLSYKNVVKDLFFKRIFLYIVFAELSLWIKEYFFGPREIRTFKQLRNKNFVDTSKIPFKIREREDGQKEFIFVPEMSFTLYELLQIPYNSCISHPLTTGVNYFSRLINTLFIDKLKLYKDKDGETQKRILFKILDSYSFGLIKKFLMLAKTIKILDHSVYKKRWIAHLKNNWDELVKLLNQYQEATKTLKSKENIQNIKLIEQEIKNFISKGHDVSYSFWLKYKNAAFASSEMKINLLFSLPSMYLVGKKIYEKYEDGTLNSVFEKIKALKDQPEFQGESGIILVLIISEISLIAGTIGFFSLINLGSPNYL